MPEGFFFRSEAAIMSGDETGSAWEAKWHGIHPALTFFKYNLLYNEDMIDNRNDTLFKAHTRKNYTLTKNGVNGSALWK